MSDCKWDLSKNDGEQCPVHGGGNGNKKFTKGQEVSYKGKKYKIGGFYKNQKLQDEDEFADSGFNSGFRGIQLLDENGQGFNINANQLDAESEAFDDDFEEEFDDDFEAEKVSAKYKNEDYEDARFYPTESTMDGTNYVGRYHSIYDAFGKDDSKFKGVEALKDGTSVYQLPDGYFSGNPRINSMSFKTREAFEDYHNRKNPDEHKYGVYFNPGSDIEQMYRGRDNSGKEYDMEAPDAYKSARRTSKMKDYVSKLSDEEKAILRQLLGK